MLDDTGAKKLDTDGNEIHHHLAIPMAVPRTRIAPSAGPLPIPQ